MLIIIYHHSFTNCYLTRVDDAPASMTENNQTPGQGVYMPQYPKLLSGTPASKSRFLRTGLRAYVGYAQHMVEL